MSSFQLTSNGLTYTFDTAGGVSLGGQAVGSWTTNAANQIVVTLAAGGSPAFSVVWTFNNKNQLTVGSEHGEIFNFASGGLYNSYSTRDAALVVKPDRAADFTFALNGDWAMTPDHSLTLTVNGI